MPRDIEAVSRDQILDNCELYERGQVSLTVLVLNIKRALGDLSEPDHTAITLHLAELEGANALPESKRDFETRNLTRAIRKQLFRAP